MTSRRGRSPRAGELKRWFDLELSLQLVAAEEKRRPLVRAWRDRRRPGIWDRHLVQPVALPEDIEQELRALDGFYRETGTEQWSVVGLDGALMTSWCEELQPFEFAREALLLMSKATVDGVMPAGVARLDGPTRYARLLELRSSMASEAPRQSVLEQLIEVMQLSEERGNDTVILTSAEDGEVDAYLMFTVVGELAWMEDLETRADRRDRGHARALMKAAEIEAHRRGAVRTGFYAAADDWPWRWYERLGWELVGRSIRLRRTL